LRKLGARWHQEDAIEGPSAPEEGVPYGPPSQIVSDGAPGQPSPGNSGPIHFIATTIVLGTLALIVSIMLAIVLSVIGLGAVALRSIRGVTRGLPR
jgi:hypothetical protein